MITENIDLCTVLAEVEMADVAEMITDRGYTAEDFKLVLHRLILDEIEYIELQHTDDS